jgi:hypothetical protein
MTYYQPYTDIIPDVESNRNNIDLMNSSGRSITDRIFVLDIRGSRPIKSRLNSIQPAKFLGTGGNGTMNMHSFSVKFEKGSLPSLKILIINHRPLFDPATGQPLDPVKVGA